MTTSFYGGGLVEEAAFYYDDPQFRWLAKNWADLKWSRGGGYLFMHRDTVGEMVKPIVPTTYDGVRALPFDEQLYAYLNDPERQREGVSPAVAGSPRENCGSSCVPGRL